MSETMNFWNGDRDEHATDERDGPTRWAQSRRGIHEDSPNSSYDASVPLLWNRRDECDRADSQFHLKENSFPFTIHDRLAEHEFEKHPDEIYACSRFSGDSEDENNYENDEDGDEDVAKSGAMQYPGKGSTFSQALLNGSNVLVGIGILSTPYALSQGGWLSLWILILFAIVCCYTGILLQNCLETQQSIQMTGYPDIGKAAFGIPGKYVICVFLFLELYAVTIELIILEGDNLSHLFPNVQFNLFQFRLDSQKTFMILFTILILPTVWIRHLHLLSYVSAGGVFASVLVVFCVWWVGEIDGVGFQLRGSLIQIEGFPAAIGLFGFCFSGHAVFPTIYTSMNQPRQFTKVLILCFIFCTLLYGGVGVMGYSMYGSNVQTQITLNLPHGLWASKVAIWTTIINPFTKYAITLSPIALALEESLRYHSNDLNLMLYGTLLRTLLVFTSLFVALSFPYFEYVMAFIGSFLSISLSVIFPCLCYVRMVKDANAFGLFVCYACCLFGFVSAVIGTFYAVQGLSISRNF